MLKGTANVNGARMTSSTFNINSPTAGTSTMNKCFVFLTITTLTGIMLASWHYEGPQDERLPFYKFHRHESLGWFTQHMDVGAVADVIEDGESTLEYPHGCFKVKIVNAIYGCTNGQELIVIKNDTEEGGLYLIEPDYDPNFEYYPTNNSRIVFAGITNYISQIKFWSPKDWNLPPQPEIFITSTNTLVLLEGFTRAWWYDGYQDNLPYTHFTNLVRAVRTERNWTNYYHAVRDAVPTPASPRVWQDSFYDMFELLYYATQAQFDYILNDPLFPVEMLEVRQYQYEHYRRRGEDE
jgi:hypothetical protein